MLSAGQTIGSYEIVSKLRSGGMAALYLGRRRGPAGFTRNVAIKVVHPHLAEDETFVQMFLDEAQLSARIDHPNVVQVEELGEQDGMYYMVMEYVEGHPLGDLLKLLRKNGLRLTTELAVYAAVQVADGLHAAHETTDAEGNLLGVVHRDVTPQNVLCSRRGHLKLIDFGIAKAAGRSHKTISGSVKGKFRYMAPEQAKGLDVDRRTDVYALGTVLWEMLTGRRLIDSPNDLSALQWAQNPEHLSPSQWVANLDPELDRVVMRALNLEPEARFATAKEFRTALVRALPRAAALDAGQLAETLAQVRAAKQSGGTLQHTAGTVPLGPEPDPAAASFPAERQAGRSDVPSEGIPVEVDEGRGPLRSRPGRRWLIALSVAAGLLVGVPVALALIKAGEPSSGQPAPTASPPQTPPVGRTDSEVTGGAEGEPEENTEPAPAAAGAGELEPSPAKSDNEQTAPADQPPADQTAPADPAQPRDNGSSPKEQADAAETGNAADEPQTRSRDEVRRDRRSTARERRRDRRRRRDRTRGDDGPLLFDDAF